MYIISGVGVLVSLKGATLVSTGAIEARLLHAGTLPARYPVGIKVIADDYAYAVAA